MTASDLASVAREQLALRLEILELGSPTTIPYPMACEVATADDFGLRHRISRTNDGTYYVRVRLRIIADRLDIVVDRCHYDFVESWRAHPWSVVPELGTRSAILPIARDLDVNTLSSMSYDEFLLWYYFQIDFVLTMIAREWANPWRI